MTGDARRRSGPRCPVREPDPVQLVVARGETGRNRQGYCEEPREIRGKAAPKRSRHSRFSFKLFLKSLGPGLITGASDDDPSGISTYNQASAQLGYGIGWTMLLTFPLMAAIQEISRAGSARVTGRSISGNVCRHYPSWLLVAVVACCSSPTPSISRPTSPPLADAAGLLVGGHAASSTCILWRDVGVAQVFMDYKRYVSVLESG